MYPWEAGEPWPGSAHPHRLWLDIWSRSRWNVRRVMTGMVIGRLWLTPDLEVLKGHSSLNRLWADVLSNHGKVSKPDENTGKVLSHMSVSEQTFKTGLYSWKQSPVWAPPLGLTGACMVIVSWQNRFAQSLSDVFEMTITQWLCFRLLW